MESAGPRAMVPPAAKDTGGIAVSYILEKMEATSQRWSQQGYLEGTALGRGPGHHMYAGPSGRPGFPAMLL